MRILYVEDNPANLFLIRRVAKVGNHEVVNYIDGEEVLRKIDITKPDLILMDIQLAGDLSGLDVVRKLRAQGYSMPIIAVTAYAMVGDRERCLEAGCDDYIAKPLPINRMVEIFEKYQKQVDEIEKRRTETRESAAITASQETHTEKTDDSPQTTAAPKEKEVDETAAAVSPQAREVLSFASAALKTEAPPTLNHQVETPTAPLPTPKLNLFGEDKTAAPKLEDAEPVHKVVINGSEDKKIEEKKRATGESVKVVEPAANNND